jgi:hypothetical protein
MALAWVRGNTGGIAILALNKPTLRGYSPTVNFRLRLFFANQACNSGRFPGRRAIGSITIPLVTAAAGGSVQQGLSAATAARLLLAFAGRWINAIRYLAKEAE